jgi:hypothetical protein
MRRFNHLAVLLVVVLQQIVGYFWYSPYLFQTSWLAATGGKEAVQAGAATPYIVAVVASIAFAYFYLLLLEELQIHTVIRSLKLAFMIWLAFLLPLIATHYLFLGYSWNLIFINSGMVLVNTMLVGYTLSAWKK